MIAMLTAVSVVTSTFFVVLRDVYGTIVFHNFLALHGVLRALVETGKITEYATPIALLLIAAGASLALLIVARVLFLRGEKSSRPSG